MRLISSAYRGASVSFWADHRAKGLGTRAEQLHPAVAHDLTGGAQGIAQILHCLGGTFADTADNLYGVAQQFLVDPRVFADFGDNRGGFIAQIAGLRVNERELPLHTEGGPR
ncbi:Uncharacterised protein [Mycobacterium tuberculosis]|nr:Uncharacterised protein [Mycobacterium tuberculosis]